MINYIKNIFFIFVFFLPLFFLPIIFPFIQSKLILINFMAIVIFSLFLVANVARNKLKISLNNIDIFLFFYLLISFVSFLNSYSPSLSLWGSFSMGTGFVLVFSLFLIYIVLSRIFVKLEDWFYLFYVCVLSGIIFNVLTLLFFNFKFFDFFVFNDSFTIGNSSYAGFYLSFIFFISLVLIFVSKIKSQKIIGFLGLFTTILNPCITNLLNKIENFGFVGTSRAGFLSIVISLIIFTVIFFIFKYRPINIKNKILIILATFILIFSIILVIKPTRDLIIEKVGPNRLIFWEIALKGFKDKPILGWGQDTYGFVYSKYFNPIINNPPYIYENTEKAHNLFLDELISGGILGLVSLLFLLSMIFIVIIRRIIFFQNKKEEFLLYLLILMIFLSFLLQWLLLFQTIIALFYLVLLISFLSSSESKKYNFEINLLVSRNVLYSCVLVYFIVSIFFLVYKPLYISYNLLRLENLKQEDRFNFYGELKESNIANSINLKYVLGPYFSYLVDKINSSDNKEHFLVEIKYIIDTLDFQASLDGYTDIQSLYYLSRYSHVIYLFDNLEKDLYYKKFLFYLDKMKSFSPNHNLTNKIIIK